MDVEKAFKDKIYLHI